MRRVTLIVVVIVLGTVALMVGGATLRTEHLARSLETATEPEEAAQIARDLLRTGRRRAVDSVARYAEARDTCAFDERHRLLLIHGSTDGRNHVVFAGPIGKPSPFEFRVDSRSVSIGDPPIRFAHVEWVSTDDEEAAFVLSNSNADDTHRLTFRFVEGRLLGTTMSKEEAAKDDD